MVRSLEGRQTEGGRVYPCQVHTSGGRVLQRVLLAEVSFYDQVGIPPWPDETVGAKRVVRCEPSQVALPARFARQIYSGGECGMGGYSSTLDFGELGLFTYQCGNIADFPDLPPGIEVKDLQAVHPRMNRTNLERITAAPFDVVHIRLL
jgi:hypothetical protein